MKATDIKRWFKDKFNIPVRVRTGQSKHPYIEAWIPSLPGRELRYEYSFPPQLGNACMRIVYSKSESLSAQDWGGNISAHSIAMHAEEWERLLATYGG